MQVRGLAVVADRIHDMACDAIDALHSLLDRAFYTLQEHFNQKIVSLEVVFSSSSNSFLFIPISSRTYPTTAQRGRAVCRVVRGPREGTCALCDGA